MQSKASAIATIDALAGSATKLNIFNFASNAPATGQSNSSQFDLSTDDGVTAAKAFVTAMGRPVGIANEGGTNWEQGLSQVTASSVKFDAVYFVTDGEPTTNEARTDGDASSPDYGYRPHNADIYDAIVAANELKAKGTRVEVLAVGISDKRVFPIKDTVRRAHKADNYSSTHQGGSKWINTYLPIQDNYIVEVRAKYISSGTVKDVSDSNYTWDGRSFYEKVQDGTYIELDRSPDTDGAGDFVRYIKAADLADPTPNRVNGVTGIELSESISSPDAVTAVSNYSSLAQELKRKAAGWCQSALIIEKQVVDSDGNVIAGESTEGWTFNASNVEKDDPYSGLTLLDGAGQPTSSHSGTTSNSGAVGFHFDADVPDSSGSVKLTETQKEGYEFKGAVCTVANDPDVDLALEDVTDNSFRVPISTAYPTVQCIVQNEKLVPENFSIEKSAQADQNPDLAGDQAETTIAFDGTFTAKYNVTVTNNVDQKRTLSNPVVDKVTFPAGFSVVDAKFYLDGTEISGVTLDNGSYTIPAAAFGEFAANEAKTVSVVVSGQADNAGQESIVDGSYEKCEPSISSPSNPRGLFNAVSLEGDSDGDSNNFACIDPVVPGIEVTKDIDSATIGDDGVDGARTVTYTVTVDNSAEGSVDRDYSLIDTPGFSYSVENKRAEISSTATQNSTATFNGAGPYDITDVLNGGNVAIDAGDTHEYTVVVHFTGPELGSSDATWECTVAGAGHGLFNKVNLESGVIKDEDDACGTVPEPPLPPTADLSLIKVGVDDESLPLTGAEFAVYEVAADGSIGNHVADLTEDSDFYTANLEVGSEYYIVETKSPENYQLLPSAVKIQITMNGSTPQLNILNAVDAPAASVKPNSSTGAVVLQVVDMRIGELPLTGGSGVGLVALLGMAILGLGLIVGRRAKA